MENILTAKEWTIEHSVENRIHIEGNRLDEWDARCYQMEKYANYKNRILESKILQFRQIFKDTNMLKRIDEHFNIQVATEGKI